MPYPWSPPLGPNAPRALLEKVAPWLLQRGRPFAPPVAEPAGKTVATLEAIGDTLWIPFGWTARVQMVGKDAAEATRALDAMTFGYGLPQTTKLTSSNNGVFTIGPDNPPDSSVAVLTSTGIGSADLFLGADAAPGLPVVPLQKVLTVHVYNVATYLVLFYTIEGTGREFENPSGWPLQLPINRTTTVRIEGRDASGNAVTLSDQVLSGGGSTFHVIPTDPPVAGSAIIVPDALGHDALAVTADGDPSPAVSTVWDNFDVGVVEPWATHLEASAGIQAP